MPTSDPRPIALVGLMGAGKSSVARLLGERLGVAVADLDARIEAREGLTVAELFERRGEREFRRLEAVELERALEERPGVLACGGGVVLDPARRALLLERCRAVWLEVAPATAAARLAEELASRPLLAGAGARERLAALLDERAALYAAVAVARVATDGRAPREVADAVLAALGMEAR